MKAPKLLPWYARKAGIPEERALELWHEAIRCATDDTGWVGNAEYWGEAMNAFIRLLDEERATLCSPKVTPLIRSQNRIMRLPLTAMEMMLSAPTAWRWPATRTCNPREAA